MPAPSPASALRRETVALQLDDVNVLGEALVAAFNEADDERIARTRVALERYVVALGWNVEAALPAIVAYAAARRDGDDDLFAPAFVLVSIAGDRPETSALLARLSTDAKALLTRLRTL
jgi:hypothetical protein